MSAEMDAHRVFCQDLVERIGCALALSYAKADLSLLDTFFNLEVLFLEVERRHKFVDNFFDLLVRTFARDYQWTCIQECKVELVSFRVRSL